MQARQLSVEDLRDVFSVSYEMAAHRFTNLATHHLGLTCHFVKNDEGGIIYKAYENDGLVLPADVRAPSRASGCAGNGPAGRCSPPPTGSRRCYQYSDTPSGTYWCVAARRPGPRARLRDHAGRPVRAFPLVPRPRHGHPPGVLGLPGRRAAASARRPGSPARWEGMAWPSARAHSHILSALPTGSFPGVDEADVYEFLERTTG